MTFAMAAQEYKEMFRNSKFKLNKGEKIRRRAKEENVPDEPGVYLIYSVTKKGSEVVYIGKAGTFLRKGTFTQQKLFGRLTRGKHDGKSAQRFLEELMSRRGVKFLEIHWFATFNQKSSIIPGKAEADLIQVYFDEHEELPLRNKTA